MKKGEKVILILCTVGVILSGIMLVLVKQYNANQIDVTIPIGNLSDSLFVSQNTSYIESKSLVESMAMNYVPYYIDVPEAVSGTVGKATVYNINDTFMYYVSEVGKGEKYHDILLNEFSKAVLMNSNADYSSVTSLTVEAGYLNGYTVEYFVDALKISDGLDIKQMYAVGYLVTIPDYDCNIVVATLTNSYSTEALALCQSTSQDALYTLRYEEKLIEELVVVGELTEEETGDDEGDNTQSAPEGENESETVVETPSSELPSIPEGAENVAERVWIDSATDLVFELSWENTNVMMDVKLYVPSHVYYFEPTNVEVGKITFEPGVVSEGEYILEIYGKDYGELSFNMYDRAVTSSEESSETEE